MDQGIYDTPRLAAARVAHWLGMEEAESLNRASVQVDRDLRRISQQVVDPVPREDWVDTMVFGTLDSAPTMLAAMHPATRLLLVSSYSAEAYGDFQDHGWTGADAEAAALTVGLWSTGVESALELVKKVPGVNQALSKLGARPGSNWLGRYLLNATGQLASEIVEEPLQDLAAPAMQALVSAFDAAPAGEQDTLPVELGGQQGSHVPDADVSRSPAVLQSATEHGEAARPVAPLALADVITRGKIRYNELPDVSLDDDEITAIFRVLGDEGADAKWGIFPGRVGKEPPWTPDEVRKHKQLNWKPGFLQRNPIADELRAKYPGKTDDEISVAESHRMNEKYAKILLFRRFGGEDHDRYRILVALNDLAGVSTLALGVPSAGSMPWVGSRISVTWQVMQAASVR